MQREQIIEALVVDCLIGIFDRKQYCWLQEILENGFRGFANMSNEELRREIKCRNLDCPELDGGGDSVVEDCYIDAQDLHDLCFGLPRDDA